METYTSLFKPFLLGIYQDVCELYSDEISEPTMLGCKNIINLLTQEDAMQLCAIGKLVEKSLITNKRLELEKLPTKFSTPGLSAIFYNSDGFPKLLENCFERIFLRDGSLVYSCESVETQLLIDPVNDGKTGLEFENIIQVQSAAAKHALACAILCIRQFYLGLSKVITWECLRRRRVGDTIFCYQNYYSIRAGRHGFIKRDKDCSKTPSIRIYGWRSCLLFTVQ